MEQTETLLAENMTRSVSFCRTSDTKEEMSKVVSTLCTYFIARFQRGCKKQKHDTKHDTSCNKLVHFV
jgi:hypothetical protein